MSLLTTTPMPHQLLRLGQPVHVNVRATWLPAVVTSLAPGRVGVNYQAPQQVGLGTVATPWTVRPAAGYRLVEVRKLAAGDQIVAADGTIFAVAAPPWRGRSGAWLIEYTNGSRAVLAPTAVLRVVDPTPQVSVHGIAL
jgi:hypothetical protein